MLHFVFYDSYLIEASFVYLIILGIASFVFYKALRFTCKQFGFFLSYSGLSNDFILSNVIKVSETKAEYFPPKEDVILQNEAPTDLYVLVSGAMVRAISLLHYA